MDMYACKIWNDKWAEDGDRLYSCCADSVNMANLSVHDLGGQTHDEWVKEMQELMSRKRG